MPRLNEFKLTCKFGHPMSGDNLRITRKMRRGKMVNERVCRECHRLNVKRRRYELNNPGMLIKKSMFRQKEFE